MGFQITDRFSFMRFLGLRSYDKVPDSNTIWRFRQHLTQGDVVKELFERFGKELNKHSLIVNRKNTSKSRTRVWVYASKHRRGIHQN